MKRLIIIYGLISGVLVAGMMWATMPLLANGTIDFSNGMFYGYTSMVIAFSMIFFAIKNYRDNYQNGSITFGKGFKIGILITVIASLMYAISWEIYYTFKGDEFVEYYISSSLRALEEEGVTGVALEAERVKLVASFEMYQNFFIRFEITLLEIFPVGLLITIFTALVLRKREILPA